LPSRNILAGPKAKKATIPSGRFGQSSNHGTSRRVNDIQGLFQRIYNVNRGKEGESLFEPIARKGIRGKTIVQNRGWT